MAAGGGSAVNGPMPTSLDRFAGAGNPAGDTQVGTLLKHGLLVNNPMYAKFGGDHWRPDYNEKYWTQREMDQYNLDLENPGGGE